MSANMKNRQSPDAPAGADRSGGMYRRKRKPARHVSDLLPDVMGDILRRRSGMNLDLIAGWAEIVGPNYADCTLPEKISWPRRMSDADPFMPGTLVINCDGAKAIFLQHETGQLLERVNFFFGFEAVGRIKIVQKPIKRSKTASRPDMNLNDHEKQRLDHVLTAIEDPQLRKRVERLGRGVISRCRNDNGTK